MYSPPLHDIASQPIEPRLHIFKQMRKNGLRINIIKYQVTKSEVKFLSDTIDKTRTATRRSSQHQHQIQSTRYSLRARLIPWHC